MSHPKSLQMLPVGLKFLVLWPFVGDFTPRGHQASSPLLRLGSMQITETGVAPHLGGEGDTRFADKPLAKPVRSGSFRI